jgi:hypothetical protein
MVIRLRSAPFGFGLHYWETVGGFVKISNPPEWQMARENNFSSSVAGWTCRVQVASTVVSIGRIINNPTSLIETHAARTEVSAFCSKVGM